MIHRSRRTPVCSSAAVLVAAAVGGVFCHSAAAQPANDTCASAASLSLDTPVNGTLVGATTSTSAYCAFETVDTADAWYAFIVTRPELYRFTVTPVGSAELNVSVYSVCDAFFADIGCAAGTTAGAELDAYIFDAGTYYVRVGSPSQAPFTITATMPMPLMNDECENATTLDLGLPVTGTTIFATTTLELDDAGLCGALPPFTSGKDVFFRFTPPSTGFYDFGTCGSTINQTVLSVHAGCPVTAANAIACNQKGSLTTCTGSSSHSYLAGVHLNAGVEYFIRLAGAGGGFRGSGDFESGDYTLYALEGVEVLPPANDECQNATPLTAGTTIAGSTIYATGEPSSCGTADAWDVWYAFTAPASSPMLYRFTIPPQAFNDSGAVISAYTSCGGGLISCAKIAAFASESKSLAVVLDPGQSIRLRIAGENGTQDEFTVQTETVGVAPPNWKCATAHPLSANTQVTVNTTNAPNTLDGSCSDFSADPFALWYSFTAPQAGYYRFFTDGFPPPDLFNFRHTTLAVYSSCGGTRLLCATQGDPLATNSVAAAGTLQLAANQTVKVRTAFGLSNRGEFTLEAAGPLPPPAPVVNDVCGSAKLISSFPFNETTDMALATDDAAALAACPSASRSLGVWYRLTPPVSGTLVVSVSAPGSPFGSSTLFTGSCGSLTAVACPEFFGGARHLIPVTAGTEYYLLTTTDSSFAGVYGMSLSVQVDLAQPPSNEACASAQPITANPTQVEFNNTLATDHGALPSCLQTAIFSETFPSDVWFEFQTQTAGVLTLHGQASDLFGGGLLPGAGVYTGSCGSLSEIACGSPIDENNPSLGNNFFDISTPLLANTRYFIAVGTVSASGGRMTLDFSYTGTIAAGCGADFNHVNGVTVQDIFDFLTAWLAGNASADFNHVNGVTVQDIFDFLTAWLAGC